MLSVSQLIALHKGKNPNIYRYEKKERVYFITVALRGLEPLLSEPKSNVLPLYNRALLKIDRPSFLLGTSIC